MIVVLAGIGVVLMLFTLVLYAYLKPVKYNPYPFLILAGLTVVILWFTREYNYALVLSALLILTGIAITARGKK